MYCIVKTPIISVLILSHKRKKFPAFMISRQNGSGFSFIVILMKAPVLVAETVTVIITALAAS